MNLNLLKEYIRQILLEGVYDPGLLKAVFMAGGPGSGKSHTAKIIFGGDHESGLSSATASGLKMVNSDPAFEMFLKQAGYDPADLAKMDPKEFAKVTAPTDSPRASAKRIRDTQQKHYTKGRLGIIIDGTGDDYGKITRKKQMLESIGYDTYMVFVNTTLEVAQERNANRDRKLPKDLVEEIWTDVQANLGAFQSLFGLGKMAIIDNTVYGPISGEISSAVNQFVSAPISNPIGRKWVEQELEKKGEEDIRRKSPGRREELLGDG